ncbi:YaaA family protein [Campylobacter vulpis]|uniref:Peroxide stress protein YaaA n=1 Tax=Campylobacter vulpis TaxID=1655500 RepID=A0ABS5P0N5_9BACT|nr:peroxide stress protein YaaA [Campylobacter vulpis]MBS4240266.1 peroxide stress protein YaaA [Campylobacter vulpis]MBS4252527.1 peroxide stress protein YaaA [Campylobacter vulpis]MBS4274775.1 peroxide stress protein YaaA [Campylobacter vulpis]MBS4281295.1 peroxide stress protein YaaA [Campylobacter vulpis]MBS4307220.1 peroxide stress protein YaaA [Campylobacter vulpis]
MKILFSPSESKSKECDLSPFDESSFIFKELFKYRLEALQIYEDYLKNANLKELETLFGIKNPTQEFLQDLKTAPTKQAIKLYTGVSYEYLNFKTLHKKAQNYILENTLIFSNLFGVVRANDTLPFYKFKQGAKLKDFNIEHFYKKHFSKALDKLLEKEEVLDLRAGFYDKFYTPQKKVSTYKFLKNGKIVSHYAKAYRGILLRVAAENEVSSNQELLSKLPPNLKLKEVKQLKLKEEITLEILD